MKNVFWLLRDRLAGRPGPTHRPWDLDELCARFDAVVNLSEHPPQAAELDARGMRHLWMALPTDVPPDAEAERWCLERLPRAEAFLRDQIEQERRVLVHCVSGKDRTGMLLTYYLAREKHLTAEGALARVRRVRPIALSAHGWEEMALRVISRLLGG